MRKKKPNCKYRYAVKRLYGGVWMVIDATDGRSIQEFYSRDKARQHVKTLNHIHRNEQQTQLAL